MNINKIFEHKDLMQYILQETEKSGIVGNELAKKYILLACVSTLNLEPDSTLNVIVEGPAGIGKTALVKSITSLFPGEKLIERSRMTPKALDHMEESLDRKIVFIEELSGNEGTYSTKIAISEHALKVDTVENNNGSHVTSTKELSAKGTSFITTTTQSPGDMELESRIIRVYPENNDEYISQVVDSILDKAKNPTDVEVPGDNYMEFREAFANLGIFKVSIPFAKVFSIEHIKHMPNVFRNLKKILAIIQAHTLLYQHQREQRDNLLIANVEDYMNIKDLLEDLVNPPSRERIMLESEIGLREFTVKEFQDVYGVKTSYAYMKMSELKRKLLVREISRGKYIINNIILPDIEVSPHIPQVPTVQVNIQEKYVDSRARYSQSNSSKEYLHYRITSELVELVESESPYLRNVEFKCDLRERFDWTEQTYTAS